MVGAGEPHSGPALSQKERGEAGAKGPGRKRNVKGGKRGCGGGFKAELLCPDAPGPRKG